MLAGVERGRRIDFERDQTQGSRINPL